ncbi:unnamed protein product [Effrenium voratum]|nr:unnamed protein product [Effrenium voratum]
MWDYGGSWTSGREPDGILSGPGRQLQSDSQGWPVDQGYLSGPGGQLQSDSQGWPVDYVDDGMRRQVQEVLLSQALGFEQTNHRKAFGPMYFQAFGARDQDATPSGKPQAFSNQFRRMKEDWRPNRDPRFWYKKQAYNNYNPEEPPFKAARAGKELRALLDFYFEPFNLQHNKYLLDLIAQKIGPSKALWTRSQLAELRFDPEDLMGLNRIAASISRMRHSGAELLPLDDPEGLGFRVRSRFWHPRGEKPTADFSLKNLRFTQSSEFILNTLLEVRGFATLDTAEHVVAHLISPSTEKVKVPDKVFSVTSLNCEGIREGSIPESNVQSTEGRIRRQLLLHHADIICLQGLDPLRGPVGVGVTFSLLEEGYNYTFAGEKGEVGVIFYDEKRFEFVQQPEIGVAAVDLQHKEAKSLIRVACVKAQVPPQKDLRKLAPEDGALVLAVDSSALGGAECLHIVEELADLRSAYREVVKQEASSPVASWDSASSTQRAVQIGASGMLKLHSPDCILCRGVAPVAVLSNHSRNYLASLSPEEAASEVPTFHMPLLAVFQWPET